MVIYEIAKDETGKRIDLTNEQQRKAVAEITTTQQLKSLFDKM
jgi:hypothetical protein